jgi:molybdenum cofactor guanylyltransferase
MGRNKASLRLGRRTLLGHVRACARNSGLPHRVIRRDLVPRCGPLGGVYTALATSRAESIVFLSCDMPFISSELVRSLVRSLGRRTNALFVTENGRVGFPFLLRRATLPIVEQLLARRRLSLQHLASALRARTARLPPRRRHELLNINTLEDWQAARKRWLSGLEI